MTSSILPPGVVFHPSAVHAYDVQLQGYNGDMVPAYVARPAAVITETIFAWPGVGRLLVESLLVRDYPTTQAVIFFVAAFILFINIFVDVAYAWLDPRIRIAQ